MQNRSQISCLLVGSLIAFSLAATGCHKEESKEQAKEATPSATPAAAPEAAPSGMFKAQLTPTKVPQTIGAGQTMKIPVKVKNLSSEAWPSDPKTSPRISYHWLDKGGKVIVWDGSRGYLQKGVGPNEELLTLSKVTAPNNKGQYTLEFDLVSDTQGGGWFGKKGSQTTKVDITVE